MIDHFNLPVSDLDSSCAFYQAVLAPLSLHYLARDGDAIGFGVSTWSFGLVHQAKPLLPLHLAFTADSEASVRAFHRAALNGGGLDNGPPGWRPEYGSNYFAAFVLDPDGHNIEAVFRAR